MPVGTRTTLSPAQTIVQQALDTNNIWLGFYTFSAWIFAEACIWSSPASAKLGWISYNSASLQEKVKLNERPIFFRCMFITLALGQSLWHIYRDEDEIPMPIRKASAFKNKDGTVISAVEPPRNQIRSNLPSIAKSATAKALILYGIGFALYYSVLRSVIRTGTFYA
jgi:nucleoporin NDC1